MYIIANKIKAVAGALSGLVGVIVMVWGDKSVSLDEVNLIWLALIPVLAGLGVYISPPNQVSPEEEKRASQNS